MANFTKTQIKSTLKKLWDSGILGRLDGAISEAIEEVDCLIGDVEEERDSIEPYENKDDLTEQQQERYEWLDSLVDDLNSLRDYLEDWQGEMGCQYDTFYERD